MSPIPSRQHISIVLLLVQATQSSDRLSSRFVFLLHCPTAPTAPPLPEPSNRRSPTAFFSQTAAALRRQAPLRQARRREAVARRHGWRRWIDWMRCCSGVLSVLSPWIDVSIYRMQEEVDSSMDMRCVKRQNMIQRLTHLITLHSMLNSQNIDLSTYPAHRISSNPSARTMLSRRGSRR